ncbi:MAG: terminase small subunit [Phycisphaeraceae bacterium]
MPQTLKQQRFVEEYLVDLNATQAAIRAGYSKRGARTEGARLLANAGIGAAIQHRMQERAERTQVDTDYVVRRLAAIAGADLRRLFDESGRLRPVTDLDDDTVASLAAIEVKTMDAGSGITEHVAKFRLADRVRALELLGKHLGLFVSRVHIEGPPESAEDIAKRVLSGLPGRRVSD